MIKTIIKILLIITLALSIFWMFKVNAVDVVVSEYVPWANCTEWWEDIVCSIEPWFDSVMWMLQAMIRWLAFIAMMWWVLFIILNWIMYMMWEDKAKIKGRIIKTLLWLILLLLSWVVLHLVAPWVYTG